MKRTLPLVITCLVMFLGVQGQTIFINEIHYDNSSTDTLEGFEIAGPAGTQLECFKVVQYRSDSTQNSNVTNLFGRIPDQCSGFGTLWFDAPGQMSNSGPRGLALVWDSDRSCCPISAPDSVYHFLSYEGGMLAKDGDAAGMTSFVTDFDEGSSVPVGNSLQLTGLGSIYTDFGGWADPTATPATMGFPNVGQVFGTGPGCDPNSVTADRLTFSIGLDGCTVPGETFDLVVCATDSTGDIAQSFNSSITLSVGAGPGTLGGVLTQPATSGCAFFPGLSLSTAGDHVINATGGPLNGRGPAYISADCDSCPHLTGVHVDACGSPEGNNEILFYNTGDYAVPVNGNTININYGMTTPLQTNYTRILMGNQDYVDSLNARAGCALFVNAADTGLIPPHTDFMIMYHDPTFVYDFGAWCPLGVAPVYVMFSCDEDWDTLGNFKNAITCGGNGSQARYFDHDFSALKNGDTCNYTTTYIPCVDLLSQADGDGLNYTYWDSNYVYRWNSCTAIAVLPVEFGPDLTAFSIGEGVKLRWSTLAEENSDYFEVERSTTASGPFEVIGRELALGNSQGLRTYSLVDEEAAFERRYYRVKAVDGDGGQQFSQVVSVSPDESQADVFIETDQRDQALELQIAGEGKVQIGFWSMDGQERYSCRFEDGGMSRVHKVLTDQWANGVYLYQVVIGGVPFHGKVWVGE